MAGLRDRMHADKDLVEKVAGQTGSRCSARRCRRRKHGPSSPAADEELGVWAVAGRGVRAIGCCSAGIVIVVPVLCCSFTAPAGGVTLDR